MSTRKQLYWLGGITLALIAAAMYSVGALSQMKAASDQDIRVTAGLGLLGLCVALLLVRFITKHFKCYLNNVSTLCHNLPTVSQW